MYAVLQCQHSFAEMFLLRTLLPRLDYVLRFKITAHWLQWVVSLYCFITLKLSYSIVLKGWIIYSTPCLSFHQLLSVFLSILMVSGNGTALFMQPHPIDLIFYQKIKLGREDASDISVHWFS